VGYHRAGFDVVGVDIKPQPRYPFAFVQADALEYVRDHGREFDAIHASPPCQAYTSWQNLNRERWGTVPEHPDLIAPTRELLRGTGRPFVIENVIGSPLEGSALLCGFMFGLGLRRHRRFEASFLLLSPRHRCGKRRRSAAVYGPLNGRRLWDRKDGTQLRAATFAEASAAMGIDWMESEELTQAIPPAYTEFVGRQLLAVVEG
jgi:DNA (cytosine-5)-methyltransferase 1